MGEITNGICRECGQIISCTRAFEIQADANDYATMRCNCPGAQKYQEEEKRKQDREEALRRAEEEIEDVLGTGADEYGLIYPQSEEVKKTLKTITTLIYDGKIKEITIKLNSQLKVSIKITSKGNIAFAYTNTSSIKNEV